MSDHVPFIAKSGDELMDAQRRAAPHWRPILHAVRNHGVTLAGIYQDDAPFRIPRGRPTILLLGDDLDASVGPAHFHAKSLRRFVSRCCYGIVVACSPEIALYLTAATIASGLRKDVVLVETRPEHEADWVDRLRQIKPGLPLMVGMVRPQSEARH